MAVANSQSEPVGSIEASADDLLAFLAQETFEYPLGNGKHAVIRSLSYAEVQMGLKKHRDDEIELSIYALKHGLVSPQMTDAQFDQVRAGRAGAVADLANKIMQISGMMQDAKDADSPLAGSGS